jgi:hypothetical protein
MLLVIICVMSGFRFQNVTAQGSQQISNQKAEGIPSASTGNFDFSFNARNNTDLFILTSGFPSLTKITLKPELMLIPIFTYHNDLLINPFLVNSSWKIPEGEYLVITGNGLSNTFNARWEMLTGKPLIDKTIVYNSPMKRTTNQNISDSFLYRLAGSTFQGVVNTKYPRLSEAPKSPDPGSNK